MCFFLFNFAKITKEANEIERLLIIIGLTPHLRPALFDIFYTKNKNFDRVFTEFGGIKGEKHGGLLPTLETASFIIAGENLETRLEILQSLDTSSYLRRNNILTVAEVKPNEPTWAGEINISSEFLSFAILNESFKPKYSSEFPAQKIDTKLKINQAIKGTNMNELAFKNIHFFVTEFILDKLLS